MINTTLLCYFLKILHISLTQAITCDKATPDSWVILLFSSSSSVQSGIVGKYILIKIEIQVQERIHKGFVLILSLPPPLPTLLLGEFCHCRAVATEICISPAIHTTNKVIESPLGKKCYFSLIISGRQLLFCQNSAQI